MANRNGIIYVDSSSTLPKGVEFADLRQVFGINSPFLHHIIDNADINKWAKFKPISHPAYGYVTAAQRKSANQGFFVDESISGSTGSLFQRDATRAFNAARETGQDWRYVRPTGVMGVSSYRIDDFACIITSLSDRSRPGYDHNAACPLVFDAIVADMADQNNNVQIRVDFYYRSENIALTDLDIITKNQVSYTWYWCVLMKVPGSNQVSVCALYTDQNYTTRLALGAPSTSIIRGFGRFQISSTSYGDCEAYLALVAVSSTPADVAFVYAPIRVPVTFTIRNANNGIRVAFMPAPGMIVTWVEQNGQKMVTKLTTSMACQYLDYGDLASDMNLVLTETFYGKIGGNYVVIKTRETPLSVGPNSGIGGVVSGDWGEFPPQPIDGIEEVAYSVKAQLGDEPPIYFDLQATPGMQQSNAETYIEVQDVIDALGSSYARIIEETP